MNCYNGERYVRSAIESIFSQTYQDWEIIFLDNSSTDSSGDIAKSFGSKLKYFRNEITVPLTKARNQALKRSNGEYIAFLDSDDIWLPTKLEKQVHLLDLNPQLGYVFSDSIFFYEDGYSRRNFSHKKPPRGFIFRDLLESYFLDIETVVIRRESLTSLDLSFDENVKLSQDRDLFLKLAYHYEGDYIDEPLAKWRVHSDGMSRKNYEQAIIDEEYILDNWTRNISDFQMRFKNELVKCRRHTIWQKALVEWKKLRPSEFRKELRKGPCKTILGVLAYSLSFFPPFVLNRCLSLYNKR